VREEKMRDLQQQAIEAHGGFVGVDITEYRFA
jgi:hypothetical protein